MEINTKRKWYLQTWFIAILIALWILIVPPILGIILIVLQHKDDKKRISSLESQKVDLENRKSEFEKQKSDLNIDSYTDLEEKITAAKINFEKEKRSLQDEIKALTNNRDAEKEKLLAEVHDQLGTITEEIEELNKKRGLKEREISDLTQDINNKKEQIVQLDDEILYQEFGLYTPLYNLMSSEEYKNKISVVRARQKEMIKAKTACSFPDNMLLDNSASKGRAMINQNVKQILRSFNNECEMAISKAKFNNVEAIRKRIEKSMAALNKMNEALHIYITPVYLSLKLDELNLCYEYAKKKQEEKEEERRIREEQKEARKLEKEIEEARKKVKKEQEHYNNALLQIKLQLENASDSEKQDLIDKKAEIEKHLTDIDTEIKDIDYREANQKAGYVYVISNIGSFGEGIYKIGMTRRLDPMDRVKELGDASVPFLFDVHAMIFTEDAPSLEAALHNAFDNKKVNMMNNRKEFFKVTLDEIEDVVKKNYDKTVEFTKTPEAEQYRETVMMKKAVG